MSISGSQSFSSIPSESGGQLEDQNQGEGSQSDSSSEYFYFEDLSEFLKAFPNPPRHIPFNVSKSGEHAHSWVFCGNSSCSSSADVGMITLHKKIISAFYNMDDQEPFFGQFWEPVSTDCRLLLSTLSQPFFVTRATKHMVMYRLHSERYQYNIDMNYKQNEGNPMVVNGGPATAFLNHLPYFSKIKPMDGKIMDMSLMLPICFPSDISCCVGVLEFTSEFFSDSLNFPRYLMVAIEDAGLYVCDVKKCIPYKTINGLRPAKDQIEDALKIVCGSHNLSLAQVWIDFEDKSHVPCSSCSDYTRIHGIKLIGYNNVADSFDEESVFATLLRYGNLCDTVSLRIGEATALMTLQDLKSRYVNIKFQYGGIYWEARHGNLICALAICLRSIDTGDFNFVFEFLWVRHSRRDTLLESMLLTLKRCLPSFKFASGEELGDELDIIDDQISNFKIFEDKTSSSVEKALEKQLDVISVESPARGETSNINAFQGKRLSPICKGVEKGKKPMVKCKTTEIELPLKDIEKHFDKTMKEAADILNVSTSTLKRKLRKHGIAEWPQKKPVKRNKNNNVSINQIDSDKEDNGATQKPSTITIKAKYGDRMISSPFLISNATFENVFQEIGKKFDLSFGTYRLEYLDKDGDWIWIASDEEMGYSIESSRKPDQTVVRLRVLVE